MSYHRPKSVAQVAEWSHSVNEFGYHLQDFLHEHAARPDPAMFREHPRLLRGLFAQGDICDAYLAAVAATLAPKLGEPRPVWSEEADRYLDTPWFATPGSAMRACLLLESPARFRERNLFVTANALSVA